MRWRSARAVLAWIAFTSMIACRPAEERSLRLEPCADSEARAELLCGRLAVHENWELREGRRIDLRVVVAPAIEPRDGASPLFLLEGGPGIAATDGAEFFATVGADYRRYRDVVMVDLRGTGGSHPLHCPDLEGQRVPVQRHLSEMYPQAEVKACRDRLQVEADLTQYTTANAVEDLDAVRRALGYERIHLQGISYGTRLGLEYIRRHPERAHSFIGIGALSSDHAMPLRHAEGFQRAFDLLLQDCEADPGCSGAYPRLSERWRRLLDRLEKAPARARYSPPGSQAIELEIRRDVFVSKLHSKLYVAPEARRLPEVIDAADRGELAAFLELTLPAQPASPSFLAEGLYLSITCTEDVPRISAEETVARTSGTYLGSYRVLQQKQACDVWPVGTVPADFGAPVRSPIPALLVTGERDPVTPPSEAQTVAATLENARVLIVPHAGHLPFDNSDPLCVDRILLSFLESGSAEDIDASCLTALEPAPFPVPSSDVAVETPNE